MALDSNQYENAIIKTQNATILKGLRMLTNTEKKC